MAQDLAELFPGIDLGSRRPPGDSCVKPVGNPAAGRRRRSGSMPRKSPLANQVAELRRFVDARFGEVKAELRLLRQQRRDVGEVPVGILTRLTEIERCLKILESPKAPALTRRNPVG
jgi:hypothetical protein